VKKGSNGVLEAFVDESGTHAGATVLSVGACVAKHNQWARFLEKWGTPSFHAKDPYSDSLKPKLAELMERCSITSVVCFVKPGDYEGHASAQWKGALGNAYAACVFACAGTICKAATSSSQSVSFFVEDGQPNSEWVERVLKSMAHELEWKNCIANITLATKKDFLQLHAADFLSHSWSTGDPIWCKRLFENGNTYETCLTPQQLVTNSEQLKQMVARRRSKKERTRRKSP
jgi:hypothetical protein